MLVHQMHVSIPYFSAIPEDVCTNVWSFSHLSLSPTLADWNTLRDKLVLFYGNAYNGTASSLTMANYAVPSLTRFKGYYLGDPIPRAPLYDTVQSLTGVATTATFLAPETALCVSFQGAIVSGQPQARRRGRIYLGAIAVGPDSSSATAFPVINATRRAGLASAAASFKTSLSGTPWTWVVASRANDQGVVVTNGWVDNALDTQRRRGQQPSARSTFT